MILDAKDNSQSKWLGLNRYEFIANTRKRVLGVERHTGCNVAKMALCRPNRHSSGRGIPCNKKGPLARAFFAVTGRGY